MSNPDPRQVISSARYKSYQNYGDTQIGTVSIPSTSYLVNTYKTYSVTIPLSRTEDLTNVKINFSHESSNWFDFPTVDLILGSGFTIATVGAYSSNQLAITFYVVNQTGGTASNTATDVTVEVRRFVAPS